MGKGALKLYSKFAGEHPCRSAISIKLICITSFFYPSYSQLNPSKTFILMANALIKYNYNSHVVHSFRTSFYEMFCTKDDVFH